MLDSIVLTTFLLSSIIAAVCFASYPAQRQKVLLGLFFGAISLQTGIKFLVLSTGLIKTVPILSSVSEFMALTIPIFIYLYVLDIIRIEITKDILFKVAVIPVVAMMFFFVFYILTDAFTKNELYAFECFIGLLSFTFLSNIIYLMLSLKEINKAVNSNLWELTKNVHIKLIWIKWLLWLFLIKAFLTLVYFAFSYLFQNTSWVSALLEVQKFSAGTITLFATAITAYFGLRNPDLFDSIGTQPNTEQKIAMTFLGSNVKKVIKKAVEPEQIENLLNHIDAKIKDQKLFLDPELNAAKLAKHVGIPVYKLTYVLNKGAEKNFNEFINAYRVEHAKNMLTDPNQAKKTIFAIALECGFASEAPFYNAFKKITDKSPAAYRSALENNN